jgi:hypothetical protein
MSAFLSVDLLTDFAAFCLTDFIDWRYIHSWFVFLTHLVNCCPFRWRNKTYVQYCCPSTVPSLWPPPPSPLPNVQYILTVCDWGGGWGGGMLKCTVDHILQEFYTLFLTRFRTYTIASPPQTKMTSKDDIKGLVSLKFLRPWMNGIHGCRGDTCLLGSDRCDGVGGGGTSVGLICLLLLVGVLKYFYVNVSCTVYGMERLIQFTLVYFRDFLRQ